MNDTHTTLHMHTRTHSYDDTHVRTRAHTQLDGDKVRMCWIDYMDTFMDNLPLWSRPGYSILEEMDDDNLHQGDDKLHDDTLHQIKTITKTNGSGSRPP